jgi:GntR family transcriptional regulator
VHKSFGNSPVPRYAQLADLFRGRISRGVWTEGQALPTIEQLTREFDVARVTVRQAINLLAREGLVSPERGRGTYVNLVPQRSPSIRLGMTLRDLYELFSE